MASHTWKVIHTSFLIPLWAFCPFFYHIFCCFTLTLKRSSNFRKINSLCVIYVTNISYQFDICLLILLMVFCHA